MRRVIATWYYEQNQAEGGAYAQVRGDSSAHQFRDVYRRCIAVFFATARHVEPDARLVLYLNHTWDHGASRVAGEVGRMLGRLGVETEVLQYSFSPSMGWPARWRNQFFVFDVLRALGATTAAHDAVVLLDSDMVWTGATTGAGMWERIGDHRALTYRIPYHPDHSVNGCSRRELTALADRLGIPADGVLDYSGGEYVGARGDFCGAIVHEAEKIWPAIRELQSRGEIRGIEEAHLLSLCYAALEIGTGSADGYVKRMWTQPLKPRNVVPADLDLPLWHLPAEKKYGIRRTYDDLVHGERRLDELSQNPYLDYLRHRMGVPRNPWSKVVRDIGGALSGRARAMLTRG